MVADEKIPALRSGDGVVWNDLVWEVRQRFLHRTIQAVGESEADDLLQEVFVRVYTHRDQICDATHLTRFVWQVWNQRVVDWSRRQKIRARTTKRSMTGETVDSARSDGDTQVLPGTTHSSASPDSVLQAETDPARRLMLDELRRLLDRSVLLTTEQKLTMVLHVSDGHSFPAIARALQRSVATTETWYYRALESLRLEFALEAYHERPTDFVGVLSDQQQAALGHLLTGLSTKKTARLLGMRVPQLRRTLAQAVTTLAQTAVADWHEILNGF